MEEEENVKQSFLNGKRKLANMQYLEEIGEKQVKTHNIGFKCLFLCLWLLLKLFSYVLEKTDWLILMGCLFI